MPHADVRVVRRTPTPEGVIATVFTTGALTATLLDVSLVPGEIEQYSGCLMHALAFVFSVDLARYDEPESSPVCTHPCRSRSSGIDENIFVDIRKGGTQAVQEAVRYDMVYPRYPNCAAV